MQYLKIFIIKHFNFPVNFKSGFAQCQMIQSVSPGNDSRCHPIISGITCHFALEYDYNYV